MDLKDALGFSRLICLHRALDKRDYLVVIQDDFLKILHKIML